MVFVEEYFYIDIDFVFLIIMNIGDIEFVFVEEIEKKLFGYFGIFFLYVNVEMFEIFKVNVNVFLFCRYGNVVYYLFVFDDVFMRK